MSSLQLRAIFISDVHLGTRDAQAEHLLDFLRHTDSDYLYLLGDVIDFWKAQSGWYWPRLHTEVVQAVMEKARRGTRVIYVPGNHDEWLRDYAGAEYNGIEVRLGLVHETLAGQRLLLLHGDEFDSAVRCNRLLSHVGSGFYDVLLFLNRAYNRVRRRLGFPYWSLSAWIKGRVKNAVEYVQRFEQAALHEAARHRVDGLVCGHIHKPELLHEDGLSYANTGDWVEHCSALVETRQGELRLIRWAEESMHWLQDAAADAAAPAPAAVPAG
jgi:UDP-2,3-diacylglucosamine pyrophosphatase LpxH